MQLGVGGIDLLHFPILASSPRDSQEQWAASNAAPGDQVQVPGPVLLRDRTEGHLFFWQSNANIAGLKRSGLLLLYN